jgi:hypothetical protein
MPVVGGHLRCTPKRIATVQKARLAGRGGYYSTVSPGSSSTPSQACCKAQTKRLSSSCSITPPPLLVVVVVVVTDSSEFIDGVPGHLGRRSPGAGGDWGLSHSSRSHDGCCGAATIPARFAAENVEHPTARLAVNANGSRPSPAAAPVLGNPPSNSGSGPMPPPRRTVSTASWQRCQLPDPSSPTAPLTGLIVRPAASYSSDWNTAVHPHPNTDQPNDSSTRRNHPRDANRVNPWILNYYLGAAARERR